jgi:hypothetical protein
MTPAPSSAGSSSGTRRHTPRCGRWSGPSSAATLGCGCCPRTPARGGPRSSFRPRRPSARATTSPQGAVRGAVTDHQCPGRRGGQGAAPGPGPRCGSCIPLVKKIMTAEMEGRCALSDRTVRARRAVAGRALQTPSGPGAATFSEIISASVADAAATSASRSSPRSSPRCTTSTCSTATGRALQDTNDRYGQPAEGRDLLRRARGCRAARSSLSSSCSSAGSPRTTGSTRRSPAASASTSSVPGSSSCPASGSGSSTAGWSRDMRTASPCAP